ncbi:biotin holocarboxylase synthetase [Coemansia sp. RSA 989]|nr:biotin-protein ligase [Coemansia mojavensis]KAJ1741138.1 biotin holocarboxylase synthetase [Coemansia sp. RSA 1086]KAJ1751644.1 biotin holocarboxylase synthetase [Coemansia sp. RSA 1821]KAJ1866331.1 biotin holocarboxylase synthetase [Coemansia sp. RSA 989]KAJ2632620.1 biotin holocarboxylase synthetase [Coemansia sp. RSA 1290]KAJ2677053.1 biotin holocarboxylase synthetase [Coemansia sp. RSA 1085]
MAGLNVLVYSGPGVSLNGHAYLLRTLRQFLGHRYAIITISPETLRTEPWESKAAMLVVPGGRDLPYVAEMNGEINQRIKAWVNKGGRYMGICAGGYYASSRCEFEPGTDKEVIGDRELAFYSGTCLGCAYPEFNYKSEEGARAVEATVDRSMFRVPESLWRSDPKAIRLHYNGGGFFVGAEDENTKVLVRYPSDVTNPYDRSQQVNSPAAIVSCTVGKGIAVLSGLHIEYAWDFLAPSSYTKPYNRNLISLMRNHDAFRRRLFGAILTHMKLAVDANALDDQIDAAHSMRVPTVTPTFMAPARASGVSAVASTMYALNKLAIAQGNCSVGNTADRVFQDVADDIHVVTAVAGVGKRRVDPEYQKLVLQPDDVGPVSATEVQPDSRKHSMLVLCTPEALPDSNETPRFDMRAAIKFMQAMKAHTAGSWLMYSDTTRSTQTFFEKNPGLLAQLPDGTVNVATIQLAGRGRGRNAWISPVGCLQFTLLIRHPNMKQAPVVMMQYLMSLAIVESIKAQPGYEDLPLRLKWPNDLYALHTPVEDSDDESSPKPTFVKIGGILVNSSYKSGEFTLLFGCGINVANALPTTSINSVIRDYNNANGTRLETIPVERALALITAKFEELYRQFLAFGFKPLLDAYYRNWLHTDQEVALTDRSYEKARVIGISASDGQLQVCSLSSPTTVYSLQPDGNSFDMLRGLISRKV